MTKSLWMAFLLALAFSSGASAGEGLGLHRLFSTPGLAVAVASAEFINMKHHADCKKSSDEGPGESTGCSSPTTVDAVNLEIAEESSLIMEKTSKGSRILRHNLNADRQAAGMQPLLPPDCEPHHIVPEGDNRKGLRDFTEPSRNILESCHIDINSSLNGIFLPPREGGKGCEGSQNHRSIHNKKYYESVFHRLEKAQLVGGCQDVKNELGEIKRILINGGIL